MVCSNEDMQLVELHFQKEDMYISEEFVACGLCIKLDNGLHILD